MLRKTVMNFYRIARLLEGVRNSSLSIEEKQKVETAYRKAAIFSAIYGSFMLISMIAMAIITTILFKDDVIAILKAVGIITVVIVIEVLILCVVEYKILKDCQKYLYLVDMGFDGKSTEEINHLKPNENEKAIITKHKIFETLWQTLMMVFLLIAGYVWFSLDGNRIAVILGCVLAIACFLKIDYHRAEIHRLSSGYYKKPLGFNCRKCGKELKIPHEELEQLVDLPKDEFGLRVKPCSNCGNPVPIVNFDTELEAYKKYKEQSK